MEIHDILGYLLNTSARLIKRKMDCELERYDITTSQWAVLKLLYSKTELSQAQISDELLSDRATIGTVIFKLLDKGLIKKNLDPADRRSYVVCLTRKSKDIVKEIENKVEKVTEAALKGMSKSDIDRLFSSLNSIINNLSEEGLK